MSLTLQNPLKDPSAELDYAFNWRPDTKPWLEADETIASYIVTPDTGITVDSSTEADGKVTVWLSGGTAGINYKGGVPDYNERRTNRTSAQSGSRWSKGDRDNAKRRRPPTSGYRIHR